MNSFLSSPWPWYIAGPILGASIPLLLLIGNKQLGASASLRHLCSLVLAKKPAYFNYDVSQEIWNILFAIGVFLGGVFAAVFIPNPETVQIAESTIQDLKELGLTNLDGLMPIELFGVSQLFTIQGFTFMVVGGFLIGFGVRYANGCTSGHGFMGLSKAHTGSLIAISAFFVGGIIATFFLLPLLI